MTTSPMEPTAADYRRVWVLVRARAVNNQAQASAIADEIFSQGRGIHALIAAIDTLAANLDSQGLAAIEQGITWMIDAEGQGH